MHDYVRGIKNIFRQVSQLAHVYVKKVYFRTLDRSGLQLYPRDLCSAIVAWQSRSLPVMSACFWKRNQKHFSTSVLTSPCLCWGSRWWAPTRSQWGRRQAWFSPGWWHLYIYITKYVLKALSSISFKQFWLFCGWLVGCPCRTLGRAWKFWAVQLTYNFSPEEFVAQDLDVLRRLFLGGAFRSPWRGRGFGDYDYGACFPPTGKRWR